MFERFTDRARRVVVLAQEEARTRNHEHITTKHLLIGLSRAEGVAAQALNEEGITYEALLDWMDDPLPNSEAPPGHIPFLSRTKKILELALRDALQLGHNYIGTEHILLGLIRADEMNPTEDGTFTIGMAKQLRKRVIQILSEPSTVRSHIGRGHNMIPLTADELVILLKARDLLQGKKRDDLDMAACAYTGVLDVLRNSYLDVPTPAGENTSGTPQKSKEN